jgi:SAM-dependent methyltransferase
MRLTNEQDAFGHAARDHYLGKPAYEIIERSDGYFAISGGPAMYLSEYASWRPHEKAALEHARGAVLDIGCNAGRHALHLQHEGLDVVGVDVSPLAIETARLRGLAKAEVLSITELSGKLGIFDTILMLGNNFGLFGNAARTRSLLRRFKGFTHPGSVLIVETLNVYQTDDPDHLSYLADNRKRGRMSGQIRMRGRYKRFVTPWFDYLMVSPEEMEALVAGTGWQIKRHYHPEGRWPVYAAIIERVV